MPHLRTPSTPARRTGRWSTATTLATGVAALAGAAAAGTAYAAGFERNNFTVRRHTLPLLAPGSAPLRLLHISDLHMCPGQTRKERFVRSLAELDPHLVIDTGDNLADLRAVPAALQALGPLLDVPGAFVFGSNDYFAPIMKNPLPYLGIGEKKHSEIPLPWQDLRAALTERGWSDATHRRVEVTTRDGHRILVAGVDDPHIGRDRYSAIAGPAGAGFDLRIGLTHAPEPRVLDRFDEDRYDLALAGHTHGGQLCLPTGAIVTNCGIDRSRVKGVSSWGRRMVLHVSAGLGTSPYVPLRTFCPPEATLLTLVGARGRGRGRRAAEPVPPRRSDQLLPV